MQIEKNKLFLFQLQICGSSSACRKKTRCRRMAPVPPFWDICQCQNFPGNLNTWPDASSKRFFLLPFLQPKKMSKNLCCLWWKYFSEFLRNYLRFSHFSIFWKILGYFSDFFRKFSIVSENYRIRNLIFKEKRRNFRFLINSKKRLPFSPDISYSLRTRWDWETKNSRKIAKTLDLKNSVKNLIFSVKNFYSIRIQQN